MPEADVKNYVTVLTSPQISRLKDMLEVGGWTFSTTPHAFWRAGKDKTTVIAYESGKLVAQGRGVSDFVLFILEPEILKRAGFGYEAALGLETAETGAEGPPTPYEEKIGVDESGKGDFFGPLVIAACYVPKAAAEELLRLGVKDSKTIKSDKKIQELSAKARGILRGFAAIVMIGPESYNKIYARMGNLNRLLAWGHARAIENALDNGAPAKTALCDQFGNPRLIKNALMEKGKQLALQQRVRAESDIAVATASILARAEFVSRLEALGRTVGRTLPKGAGNQTLTVATELVREKGPEVLNLVAKVHFSTTAKAVAAATASAD